MSRWTSEMKEKGLITELAVFGLALATMLVCAVQVKMGTVPMPVLLATFLGSWLVFSVAMGAFVRMFRALG